MMLSTLLRKHSILLLFSHTQLIMESDALDYALTAIISIVNEENKVYSVTFHSCTFTMAKLNYDTYNKKLFAIFEAFKALKI